MFDAPQPTCFLIADIAGYTSYLAGVELDHAQDILADLIGSAVSALGPSFALAKLEGDAAFTYYPTESIDGSMLLDTIESCYFVFRRRRRDVDQATSCKCNACIRIPDLDLKFVAHHGEAVFQDVAGSRELLGRDVIVVHRLLKNHVVDQTGIKAYALITDACLEVAGLEPSSLGMAPLVEEFEGVGEIGAWVHDLEARWREEDARTRVRVEPSQAALSVVVDTAASPQVAWEFLTRPGQRMSWQPWVTGVEVKGAIGGRLGPGASNHCMHGRDTTIEEILDWRPFDYVTDRTIIPSPAGDIEMLHTTEFEPIPTGTRIHMRFALPEEETQRQAALGLGDEYELLMRSALPELASQLDAESASRGAEISADLAERQPGL